MFFVMLFLLLIILMAIGVISIFGDTNLRPARWGLLATIFGTIWTWILLAWGNFVEFIWIPAWETIMAKRPVEVYEIGAVILVFGLIIYTLSMLRTAVISWGKDGIIRFST